MCFQVLKVLSVVFAANLGNFESCMSFVRKTQIVFGILGRVQNDKKTYWAFWKVHFFVIFPFWMRGDGGSVQLHFEKSAIGGSLSSI